MIAKLTIVLLVVAAFGRADILNDCSKLFNPQRYLAQLPSLSLPYVSSLPIPSQVTPIRPSPVVTTKVVSVVTKYINKSPVCIRYSGEKPLCKAIGNANANPYDHLITKGQFINGGLYGPHYGNLVTHNRRSDDVTIDKQNVVYLESSTTESQRSYDDPTLPTPGLNSDLKDVLIDDRLKHLEEILPYYTRKRRYETSTITVTKVVNSGEPMATLVVKNCIPQGMEICPKKTKKRKSKVASFEDVRALTDSLFG